MAATSVFLGVFLLAADQETKSQDWLFGGQAYNVFGVGNVVSGGVYGFSALRGFDWTTECRDRQAMSEQARADRLHALTPRRAPMVGVPSSGGHLVGISPDHLDAFARLPGRVKLADEVLGRLAGRSGSVRQELKEHPRPGLRRAPRR